MKKFILILLLLAFCSSQDYTFYEGEGNPLPLEEEFILNWLEDNRVIYPELTEEELAISINSYSLFPEFTYQYEGQVISCEIRDRGMNIEAISNEPHPVSRSIVVSSSYNCNFQEEGWLYGTIWYQYEQWWGLVAYERVISDFFDEFPEVYDQSGPKLGIRVSRVPLIGIEDALAAKTTYLYTCEDWSDKVNEVISAISFANSSSRVTMEKYTEFYSMSNIPETEMLKIVGNHYSVFILNTIELSNELMEITVNANISDDQILISDTISLYTIANRYVWRAILMSLEDPNFMTPEIQEITDETATAAYDYNEQLKTLIGDYEELSYNFLKNLCEA